MKHTVEEWDILARTVYGEARGESFLGQVAVAWVVRNRVSLAGLHPDRFSWWGTSIVGVCRKPKQFSCWNDDDPNFQIISAACEDHPQFRRALGVAALVLSDDLSDPTSGATHYYAEYIPKPSWATTMTVKNRIGLHVFLA